MFDFTQENTALRCTDARRRSSNFKALRNSLSELPNEKIAEVLNIPLNTLNNWLRSTENSAPSWEQILKLSVHCPKKLAVAIRRGDYAIETCELFIVQSLDDVDLIDSIYNNFNLLCNQFAFIVVNSPPFLEGVVFKPDKYVVLEDFLMESPEGRYLLNKRKEFLSSFSTSKKRASRYKELFVVKSSVDGFLSTSSIDEWTEGWWGGTSYSRTWTKDFSEALFFTERADAEYHLPPDNEPFEYSIQTVTVPPLFVRVFE